MQISRATLTALAYDEVVAAHAARCRTDLGRERALARPFFDDAEQALESLSIIEEARTLHTEPLSLPVGGLFDVRPALERASKAAVLLPAEIQAVTAVLFAADRTHELLSERAQRYPGLMRRAERLPRLRKLAARLESCFEVSGEISDRASPSLKEARDRLRGLHKSIKERLDALLHDEKFTVNLQEQYYSVRHGRYVVPVLSSAQREVPGIVHNASQTGQTLFVEPQGLITHGNNIAIAESVVLEEEIRVLAELSRAIAQEAASIDLGVVILGELDEIEAAARLAQTLDAHPPTLEPSGTHLNLKSMRHPLLALQPDRSVVANDLALSAPARSLVISGPNAGGKTVTLSGLGLCALMFRAGFPIPAETGSTLPFFASVSCALGDSQDLTEGLSTFSAHLKELQGILEGAGSGTLVLVDEIAADTDPKEGAALAIAILEELLDKGALALVTTHLEELKALAQLDPRFVNARVGFDSKKHQPTYRLHLGAAGSSSAIDLAARMGLSPALCQRANALIAGNQGALSQALDKLEKTRAVCEALEIELTEKTQRLDTSEREHKAQVERFEAGRAEAERQYRTSLKAELDFARAQVQALIDAMKKQSDPKVLERASADLRQRAVEQERALAPAPSLSAGPLVPKVGGRAFYAGLQATVDIISLEGDFAWVAAGALKTRVKLSDLSSAVGAPKAVASKPKVDRFAAGSTVAPARSVDVRGQRAEDALRMVERALDDAMRGDDAAVLIVHGHGTGALKASLREFLKGSPYAAASRPGDAHEGGDGVTVVTLKS